MLNILLTAYCYSVICHHRCSGVGYLNYYWFSFFCINVSVMDWIPVPQTNMTVVFSSVMFKEARFESYSVHPMSVQCPYWPILEILLYVNTGIEKWSLRLAMFVQWYQLPYWYDLDFKNQHNTLSTLAGSMTSSPLPCQIWLTPGFRIAYLQKG